MKHLRGEKTASKSQCIVTNIPLDDAKVVPRNVKCLWNIRERHLLQSNFAYLDNQNYTLYIIKHCDILGF